MGTKASGVAEKISRKTAAVRRTGHDKIDKVADLAKPALERMARRAHDVVERVGIAGSDTGEKLVRSGQKLMITRERMTDRTRRMVSEHPLVSVGVAVAGGMLAYRYLTRRDGQ